MNHLDITVADGDDGRPVVTVAGEVDLDTIGPFRAAIMSDGNADDLVVDLGGVTYIDSAGIAALFARASSGSLEVRYRPGSVVEPLISVTKLDSVAVVKAR